MRQIMLVLAVSALGVGALGQCTERPFIVLPSGERWVAGQALVKLNPALRGLVEPVGSGFCRFGVPELDELCRREGVTGIDRVVPQPRPNPSVLRSGADLLYLVSFDPSADISHIITELEKLPDVDGVWPNAVFDTEPGKDERPNDSLFPKQWHLDRIHAPQAWDIAHGDSTVLTAVVCGGMWWMHPDIEANLWVNTAEDINGNGRFDTLPAPNGDIDGVDQDQNGYTDDVVGYDFYHGDPNPLGSQSDAYTTHLWGTQNAVTDNVTGVAAPPWNVRSMAMQCGDQGSVSLSAATSAIYYAGAKSVWVALMSFGSPSPYQPLADACQSFWNEGGIPLAPAGTDGGELPRYPACYDDVVAVAASGQDDRKASFSNYGSWIDVTAPGVDILSTVPPDGYGLMDGCSCAAAVAAGILAWIGSAYPGVSNDSAVGLLKRWCDTMPDTLYRLGKLGAGRVSMVDSVTIGIVEGSTMPWRAAGPTLVRGVLWLQGVSTQNTGHRAELHDAAGRKVLALKAGANDVSRLAPGIYFLRARGTRCGTQNTGCRTQGWSVRKLVIAR